MAKKPQSDSDNFNPGYKAAEQMLAILRDMAEAISRIAATVDEVWAEPARRAKAAQAERMAAMQRQQQQLPPRPPR